MEATRTRLFAIHSLLPPSDMLHPTQICKCVVVYRVKGDTRISALFENCMDFIGHPKSLEEGLKAYQTYIDQGWIPMTALDITETSGVSVNDKIATYVDAMRDNCP